MGLTSIAVVGAKGGTGKTATVAALGHAFAELGFDVVMVDVDPQASLTRRCGLSRPHSPLATPPVRIASRGVDTPGSVTLLPGGRALESADERTIMQHLHAAKSLGDLVIVDTPPALGPSVRAALRLADLVLVPCTPGIEAVDGFADMRSAAVSINPAQAVRAVLVMARSHTRIMRWSLEQLTAAFPGCCYEGVVIPHEMAAAESAVHRQPVTKSAPSSRSAVAYRALAQALAIDLALTACPSSEVA